MVKNKYSHLFREDMSSYEARSVFYSACDTIPKEDMKELKEAYSEVIPTILLLEIEDAMKNQYM